MTETRETKIRERFEKWATPRSFLLNGSRTGGYEFIATDVAWNTWKDAYSAGRADALEEAAQLARDCHDADGSEYNVADEIEENIRSLSSKKDSQPKGR